MHNRHLNGWKEIGSYLGRAVRTAQRWEAQLGMPVHRPAAKSRAVVIGIPKELDTWLTGNRPYFDSDEAAQTTDALSDIAALNEKLTRLQTEAIQLTQEIARVRGVAAALPKTDLVDFAAIQVGSD